MLRLRIRKNIVVKINIEKSIDDNIVCVYYIDVHNKIKEGNVYMENKFNEQAMKLVYRVLEETGTTLLINEYGFIVSDLSDISPDAYELYGENINDIVRVLPYQLDSQLGYSIDELKIMNDTAYGFAIDEAKKIIKDEIINGTHPILAHIKEGLTELGKKSNFYYTADINHDMKVKVELHAHPQAVAVKGKIRDINEVCDDLLNDWRLLHELGISDDYSYCGWLNRYLYHITLSLGEAMKGFEGYLQKTIQSELDAVFSEQGVHKMVEQREILFNKYGVITEVGWF